MSVLFFRGDIGLYQYFISRATVILYELQWAFTKLSITKQSWKNKLA